MRKAMYPLLVALLIGAMSMAAYGQSTTATIRGVVTDAKGAPVADAEVNAVGADSGFVRTVKSGPDGSYTLNGLTPGLFKVVVSSPGVEPQSQDMRVLVGQNVTVNFTMSGPTTLSESITVVGDQLVETRTSEIATNVTTQQIENLPQSDRNFLNFAALAPGIRLSSDPLRKTFASGALGAEQPTSSSMASASKTTSCRAGSSARTRAAAIRFRRTRSRSSGSSPRTTVRNTITPPAPSSPPSPNPAATRCRDRYSVTTSPKTG